MEPFPTHMSDSDALMWDMEKDPRLRSTITVLLLLDSPPAFADVRAQMDRLVRIMPRFRQRVAVPPLRLGLPRYVDDGHFDLDYHVRQAALPAPGSLRQALDLAQAWAMSGLDRSRPLWSATLLTGLEDGAALVLKLHHSMIDGVGGMQLAMHLVQFDPEAQPEDAPRLEPPREPSRVDLLRDSAVERAGDVAGTMRSAPGRVVGAAGFLRHPIDAATDVNRFVRSAAKILAPATTMLSPVMTERSTHWRYDVHSVDFDELHRAAKAAKSTVNDAFVAAICGAMRMYHEAKGWPVDELRMTMPVNLRGSEDPAGGNRISPLRFRVPVGITDPSERIDSIHRIVQEWREEPALAGTEQLAWMLHRLPKSVMTAIFGGMLTHVDFLTSNVPGIPVPSWLAGSRVTHWYALGPTEGSSMNVTLLSHDGTCCIGVTTDRAAIDDPSLLQSCIADGFAEVLKIGG